MPGCESHGTLKQEANMAQSFTTVFVSNTRKSKVRTGCITCKIRKVKCDEGKPSCRRCSDTGRKCDGYQTPEIAQKTNKEVSVMVAPEPQRPLVFLFSSIDSLPLSNNLSNDERFWLRYFSEHAGPALSSLTDRQFWSQMIPQLSVNEPAVRHALLALSTSYARLQSTHASDETKNTPGRELSINYYNQAISNLLQHGRDGSQKVEVPLMCCLLFICLESLYKNRLLVLDHLRSGLNILNSMESTDDDGHFLRAVKEKLQQIFRRLEAQTTISGNRTPNIVALNNTSIVTPSKPFADIFDAKVSLDAITSANLNFIRAAVDDYFLEAPPEVSPFLLQRKLQEQIMTWRFRLDELEQTFSPLNVEARKIATQLRIQCSACFIYLSTCLKVSEAEYDLFHAEFTTMLQMARTLFDTSSESPPADSPASSSTASSSDSLNPAAPFSLEISLVPSLYLIAIKCRDPNIRREALALLESHPRWEGLWESKLHARAARRVIEIEESNMLICRQGATAAVMEPAPSLRMQTDNGAVLTQWPETQFRVRGTDIFRVTDEASRLAKAVFTVAVEDLPPDQWTSWEEEIWY